MARSVRTCFGSTEQTFRSLVEGRCGVSALRWEGAAELGVRHGYHVDGGGSTSVRLATTLVEQCVEEVARSSGLLDGAGRVVFLVGTGLRELRTVEQWACGGGRPPLEDLDPAAAIERVVGPVGPVVTLSNACAASGHALALAQDVLEADEADVAVVIGSDAMTASMLAMIGRVAEHPTERVRPFDASRGGVLLGEGAAAAVLVRSGDAGGGVAVLGTGLSCDAGKETAPDADGIERAVRDGLARSGLQPGDVDLVVAHGTGTALNDTCEAEVLVRVFSGREDGPVVTALKGAVGHMSGAAALFGVVVAAMCIEAQVVPPIVGLGSPIPEASGLRLAQGAPACAAQATGGRLRVAQVNAFGFGGVNSVSFLAAS